MNNIRISINLTKLQGARLFKATASNGKPDYYCAIPVSQLFNPKNEDAFYLMATMISCPNALYGDFMIKPYTDAKTYANMRDEEKRAIPVIGKGTFMRQQMSQESRQRFEEVQATSVASIIQAQGDTIEPDPQATGGKVVEPSPKAPFPAVGGTSEGSTFVVRNNKGGCSIYDDMEDAMNFANAHVDEVTVVEMWHEHEIKSSITFNKANSSWEVLN